MQTPIGDGNINPTRGEVMKKNQRYPKAGAWYKNQYQQGLQHRCQAMLRTADRGTGNEMHWLASLTVLGGRDVTQTTRSGPFISYNAPVDVRHTRSDLRRSDDTVRHAFDQRSTELSV